MRRTQLYLDDQLWKLLHTVARQSGKTISELAREALRARYGNGTASRKEAFENVIGLWKDRNDLGDAGDYVRAIRRGSRLKRFSR